MPIACANSPPAAPEILGVEQLTVEFAAAAGLLRRAATTRAVDRVSFRIERGRTFGLVGESGSGKSTLARAILRLVPATGGRVVFDGVDLLRLPARRLKPLRRRMQIVLQDPMGTLNPRLRVETLVGEALHVHGLARGARQRRERVTELLRLVGLGPDTLRRFPRELSGGQRQRIGIARALALQPQLVILDEPVSALDVSIQGQVLNLLADLQQELGLSYLFIAHNLAVVQHLSDQVGVMYQGRLVELAPVTELFANARHPYTQALLAAAAEVALGRREDGGRPLLPPELGEPGGGARRPAGCAFQPRCPIARPACGVRAPELMAHAGLPPDHWVACHYPQAR